jgi:hypothetical protein
MRGAFTGAAVTKKGLLETAEHGTVFLDEISEMSPMMQVKLLRVLQERTFRRLGGAEEIVSPIEERVKALLALWDDYVRANNVILPSRTIFETLEGQLPKRTPVDAGYPPLIYKKQFVPPQDMVVEPKP